MPDLKKVKARTLMSKIIEAQIETGQPYMLYKDSVNRKSNQKNIGVIKSSNLCAEIVEYSEKDETAVCNLASIALPKFVNDEGKYDYQNLYQIAKLATKNLDQVIDINFYPTDKTQNSNSKEKKKRKSKKKIKRKKKKKNKKKEKREKIKDIKKEKE